MLFMNDGLDATAHRAFDAHDLPSWLRYFRLRKQLGFIPASAIADASITLLPASW
jgi:hypothetical protein